MQIDIVKKNDKPVGWNIVKNTLEDQETLNIMNKLLIGNPEVNYAGRIGSDSISTLIFRQAQSNTTTRVIAIPDDFVGYIDVVECCKTGPITKENFCPNCGKKIIRTK